MAKRVYEYDGEAVTVSWDKLRCIHAEECLRGLPEVFDPNRRPWIEPDRAAADAVADVVVRCPTGALKFERRDGGADETPLEGNRVRIVADGPLYAHGELSIKSPDGALDLTETRAALCRCGDSANKPFCDNTHLSEEFHDPGDPGRGGLKTVDSGAGSRRLTITVAPDGPLILNGPLELSSSDGSSSETGNKTALCRCGASENKPYCDGTHVAIGFKG